MARILTTKFIGGQVVPVIQCDDFDFAGLGNPSNLSTLVQVIHTTAPGIFSTLGWYYWNAGVWTLMDSSTLVGPQYASAVSLAQTAIPSILVPNGTVAANGAITLGTALPAIYAAAWIYLPAGAIVGGAAGLYYATFSSTTVGQVYTNYVNPASTQLISAIPSGTPVAAVGSGSAYTTVVATDTPLATVDVPGLLMGANGRIRVTRRESTINNANVKTSKFTFGGAAFGGALPLASIAGYEVIREISNRGAASQFSLANAALTSEVSGTPTYTTVNTAVDQLLQLTANVATATDYVVLEALAVEVLPN